MTAGVTLQPAYVLHHRAFRDTSMIVDLLTPEYGRLSAVAKGVRTAKSKRRVLLQPFRPLLASWVGRSELRTLTTVEDHGLPLALQGDALACAYYVSELSLRLVPTHQGNVEAFAHYSHALSRLTETDELEAVLRVFELELLDCLGLLPELSHCVDSGDRVEGDAQYLLEPLSGVRQVNDHVSEMAIPVSGHTLNALMAREFADREQLRAAKHVMRALVSLQLGPTPLKSRSLFADRSATETTANGDTA